MRPFDNDLRTTITDILGGKQKNTSKKIEMDKGSDNIICYTGYWTHRNHYGDMLLPSKMEQPVWTYRKAERATTLQATNVPAIRSPQRKG